MQCDFLIVGAGFAGSVLAERLANQANMRVLLLDKRSHVGGNAYDYYNDDDILIHKYGPHIFHTNSREVFSYLSLFTDWRSYTHRVLTSVDGKLLPFPINLITINHLFDIDLTSTQLVNFLAERAEPRCPIRTAEDVIVNKIGYEIYEKFFRNYTRKQWGYDPAELAATITARVPVRTNTDDRYFTDAFQAMPLQGYTHLFKKMLSHPNIKIELNTNFQDVKEQIHYRYIIYTGPIDEFFNFCYGRLPYRSLRFVFQTLDLQFFQAVAVVNYPNDHEYTRITEFKQLTGQSHLKTTIAYEYPCAVGDPYYPIITVENRNLFKKYEELANSLSNVYFSGRLATYQYYNMDQIVAQSLHLYKKIMKQIKG